jgi:hypothetical protein
MSTPAPVPERCKAHGNPTPCPACVIATLVVVIQALPNPN